MPAVSKKQQRFFGMVRAAQKGEMKNPSAEVLDVADDISVKDAKKFAKTKHKGLPEKIKEGNLHKWFSGSKSKDGKKGWVNVTTGGTCASDEPGEGTPKCVSSSKRASMTKAERESASRRKKKADPGQQSKSGAAKPTYVRTDAKNKMKESYVINLAAHKAAQKKSKMRKLAIGNANPNEKAVAKKKAGGPELVGEKCWDGYTQKGMKKKGKRVVPNCVKEGGGYQPEIEHSKMGDAKKKADKKKESKLPPHLQGDALAKMKKAFSEEDKKGSGSGSKDACYKKVKASAKVWPSAYASGRLVQCRKKGAANYGNSKKESFSWRDDFEFEQLNEGAAWTKKEGKNKSGGLNEKGRKSYEKENPGSDLKAPSKKVGNPRRKSFCARMKGMRKRQKPSNNTGDDRLSKSLRAWNC